MQSARPRELEDWLNFHIYHPLSYRLALLLTGTIVSPNAVSVFGGFVVVAAAFAYVTPGWPLPALVGLALHMSWHVVDGADGDLARLTGKAGPLGEVVDGISDYLSHIILYCMLATLLAADIGLTLAWAAALGAGFSRIVQANHYEVHRRQYQWLVYGKDWIVSAPYKPTGGSGKLMAGIAGIYVFLAKRTARNGGRIEELRNSHMESPQSTEHFRTVVASQLRPLLSPLGPLGANYRTIILGMAMVAGSPLWFFLYEILILNLVLAWSLLAHAKVEQRISEELGATQL